MSESTDMVDILNGNHSTKLTSYDGHKNLVKLPVMDLSEFYGNHDGWLSFHDSFTNIIVNDTLSKV